MASARTASSSPTNHSPTLRAQRPGEKTPLFIRFSTVAGSKGSADLARDVRGFAVKFYTKEGNWDLVGNNVISHALIARATTYQELGPAYLDRRQAERSIRRCVRTLERLGHKVTIEPLAPAA